MRIIDAVIEYARRVMAAGPARPGGPAHPGS
jgi:hypothetical protein